MHTVRLRVQLREVEPVVVRVLDVPRGVGLVELHRLLQAAVGWVDVHLHEFDTGTVRFGPADDSDDFDLGLGDGSAPRDEAAHTLGDLGARWVYRYDFGDGWTHDVEVLGSGAENSGCVDGEGPCPPEDCGGPTGYDQLREALADPAHPEHATTRGWLGGPLPDFDAVATDLLVRQSVGAVPESVRLLLDLVGDGVALTSGGRLPRHVVRAMQAQRPQWSLTERPAHLEEDLIALAALHDLLREVGLLRIRHGTLRAIKAAGDDQEVLRRLRSWFGPDDGFTALLAGDAVALLAAHGPLTRAELSDQLLALLGRGWTRAGVPLDTSDLNRELARIAAVLEGLDQIARPPGGRWAPGPSARWLLPRAVTLAALWTPDQTVTQPHYA